MSHEFPAPTIIDAQGVIDAQRNPNVREVFAAQSIPIAPEITAISSEELDQLGEKLTQEEEALVHDIVASTEVGSVAFASSHIADVGQNGLRALAQKVAQRQVAAGFSGSEVRLSYGLQTASPGTYTYGERDPFLSGDPIAEATRALDKAVSQRQKYGSETLGFFELPDSSDSKGMVDVRYFFHPRNGYQDRGHRTSSMEAAFKLPANEAMRLLGAVERKPSIIQRVLKDQALALGITESQWPKFVAKNEKGEPLVMGERTLVVGAYGEADGTYQPAGDFIMLHQDEQSELMPDLSSVGAATIQSPDTQAITEPVNSQPETIAASVPASSREQEVVAPEVNTESGVTIADIRENLEQDMQGLPNAERLRVLTDAMDLWDETLVGKDTDSQETLMRYREMIQPLLARTLYEGIKEQGAAESMNTAQLTELAAERAVDSLDTVEDLRHTANPDSIGLAYRPQMFMRAYEEISGVLGSEMSAADYGSLQQVLQRQSWRARGLGADGTLVNEVAALSPTTIPEPSAPYYVDLYKLHVLAVAARAANKQNRGA